MKLRYIYIEEYIKNRNDMNKKTIIIKTKELNFKLDNMSQSSDLLSKGIYLIGWNLIDSEIEDITVKTSRDEMFYIDAYIKKANDKYYLNYVYLGNKNKNIFNQDVFNKIKPINHYCKEKSSFYKNLSTFFFLFSVVGFISAFNIFNPLTLLLSGFSLLISTFAKYLEKLYIKMFEKILMNIKEEYKKYNNNCPQV